MKSEEAKKKWCPFARYPRTITRDLFQKAVSVSVAGVNRLPNGELVLCLAEECMMWTGEDCGLKRSSQCQPSS